MPKAKLTKSWSVTLMFAILTAVLPIINEPLQDNFGITITETELTHFLTALGITGALGTGAAVRKQLKPKQSNNDLSTQSQYDKVVARQQVDQIEKLAADKVQNDAIIKAQNQRIDDLANQVRTNAPDPTPARDPTPNPEVHYTSNNNILDNSVPTYSGTDDDWQRTNFVRSSVPGQGNIHVYGTKYLWVKVPSAKSYVSGIVKHKDNGTAIGVGQSQIGGKEFRITMLDNTGKPLPKGKYVLTISADAGTSYYIGSEDEFEVA